MRSLLLVFFLLSFFSATAQPPRLSATDVEAEPLTFGITKGPYPVGYRAMATFDLTRPPIPDQSMDGTLLANFNHQPGRQMQLHLWFPTTSPGRPMRLEEYVWELARDLDFGWEMTEEKKLRATEEFLSVIQEHHQGDSLPLDAIRRLLKTRMTAARDFTPAKGKFPVVVIPCWKPTMETSIMAEYLARHGFVVMSLSLKGTDSNLPEISARGIATQARDIAFALSEVRKLPFADINKIALMGTGINATGCVAALMSQPQVKAFISLEGGILSLNEKQFLQQANGYDPSQLTVPMLFIHAPHPSIAPEFADDYKYASRSFVNFPTMSEHYFLNYGAYEQRIPGLMGKPPGNVVAGYQWGSELVREFLNVTLNERPEQEFASSIQKVPATLAVTYHTKTALARVPSLHELKVFFSTNSAEAFLRWYDAVKQENVRPYGSRTFADLVSWLGFQRDSDFSKREAVVKVWNESLPLSASGYFAGARLATLKADLARASGNYKKALDLLDGDEDIYLDNVTRQRIKTSAREALASQKAQVTGKR